ncbi:type VI secretion system-associated FHA domain protein TagH [Novosphingobium sp. Chol11]|uniref:type VI secretion system-associated FHA domain protein TagH n=1 Tax=Novosphingobium sp. Chol11 TaxID=1385763 RepID=UPI0025D70DA4|nr:type VI secretion system-associated FHA domain protein TagH [Novosphingobium sp. Chol11]
MPLTLTLRNTDRLDNGSPISLVLDKRGAIIGRAATVDWCLPDPTRELSSRHCEIQFRDGAYVLTDISTNGTFLQGSAGRLPAPRTIAAGDVFVIGQFEIVAALDDATAAAMAARNASPPPPAWKGWGPADGAGAPSPAPVATGWDAAAPSAAISGAGPMSGNWAAPSTAPAEPAAPAGGGWGAIPSAAPAAPNATPGWGAPAAAPPPPSGGGWGAPPTPAQPASGGGWGAPPAAAEPASGGWGASAPPPAASFAAPAEASTWEAAAPPPPPPSDWSTPAAAPPPPSAADVWGQVAASNVVDWARGGFGAPAPAPAFDPAPAPAFAPLPSASAAVAPTMPPAEHTAMPAPISAPAAIQPAPAPAPPGPTANTAGGIEHLLAATGLGPAALKQEPAAALRQAGDVLRRLVAGFVVMLEARARAKSQLGAAGTSLEFDGNNPLKFARTPEQALAQLLNPAERGFMPADRAIEDAFRDLQAHQVATLKAMQGALRATLERFSPTAIRGRADQRGLIAKIMPGARDAALWQTYEREFGGVAQGSDEAFMDVFAKEFRKAYDEAVHGG